MRLLPFLRFSTCYFSHSSLGVIRAHFSRFSILILHPQNCTDGRTETLFSSEILSDSVSQRDVSETVFFFFSYYCFLVCLLLHCQWAVQFVFAHLMRAAAFDAIKSNWITAFDRVTVCHVFLNYIFSLSLFFSISCSIHFANDWKSQRHRAPS